LRLSRERSAATLRDFSSSNLRAGTHAAIRKSAPKVNPSILPVMTEGLKFGFKDKQLQARRIFC
jgi:hypothetical protein